MKRLGKGLIVVLACLACAPATVAAQDDRTADSHAVNPLCLGGLNPFCPNEPPAAGFTFSPGSPVAGQQITFTSTSSDTDGSVTAQAWDLDDDGAFDDGTTPSVSRSFPAGSHEVSLQVTDDDGDSAFVTRTVRVVQPPSPRPPNGGIDPKKTSCSGLQATIIGTPGNDRIPRAINGTSRPDVIVGLGGNDQIFSGRGHDLICAGPGADKVQGGPGADHIVGGAGRDRLEGRHGKDMLIGGPGRDLLLGGSGRDKCLSGPGKDRSDSCRDLERRRRR